MPSCSTPRVRSRDSSASKRVVAAERQDHAEPVGHRQRRALHRRQAAVEPGELAGHRRWGGDRHVHHPAMAPVDLPQRAGPRRQTGPPPVFGERAAVRRRRRTSGPRGRPSMTRSGTTTSSCSRAGRPPCSSTRRPAHRHRRSRWRRPRWRRPSTPGLGPRVDGSARPQAMATLGGRAGRLDEGTAGLHGSLELCRTYTVLSIPYTVSDTQIHGDDGWAIAVTGLAQVLRRPRRPRRHRPRRPAWLRVRPPRPERGGQDDAHPHPVHPRRPGPRRRPSSPATTSSPTRSPCGGRSA